MICKRLSKSRKKVIFNDLDLHYLLKKEDFTLVCTIFVLKIHGKFMYKTSDIGSFHGQGRYIIK